MLTNEELKLIYDKIRTSTPGQPGRLRPTARLFIMALQTHDSLSIGDMSEFTGSTPFNIQRLGAQLYKRGLVSRSRIGGIVRYTLVTPTTTLTTIPDSPADDRNC
jgi:DNA-binding MarR family transcriptional regulator